MKRSELRAQIVSCRRCPLADNCEGPVPFTGAAPSRIAIIGEAPGRQEDEKGKPFLGPAGKLLWESLAKYGVYRDDVFVCNSVSCYPHGTPTDDQIDACHQNLIDQLRFSQALYVLALGKVAWLTLNWPTLAQEDPGTITQVRGQVFIFNGEIDAFVFPTYHPAAILRDPLKRKAWRADLRRFCKAAVE